MHTFHVASRVPSSHQLPVPHPLTPSFVPRFRIIADALGGEVDAETYELSFDADADDVAAALEDSSGLLGNVVASRTISGKIVVPDALRQSVRIYRKHTTQGPFCTQYRECQRHRHHDIIGVEMYYRVFPVVSSTSRQALAPLFLTRSHSTRTSVRSTIWSLTLPSSTPNRVLWFPPR